jgi:hypothetical protein
VVEDSYNPSSWEAKARSGVLGQPGLQSKILSHISKNEKEKSKEGVKPLEEAE